MESLLLPEERVCDECGDTLSFRLSRFGCVYSCSCQNKFFDFFKALSKYISALQDGFNTLTYVPSISTESALRTDVLRVVVVELNFFTNSLSLAFKNFSSKEKQEIFSMLSGAFQRYLSTNSVPIGMVDLFIDELECISNSCHFKFFISPPSRELLAQREFSFSRSKTETVQKLLVRPLLAILRPHQLLGIEKVLHLGGRALIADEMGVGKTLEAIGVIAAIQGYPLLLVTPSALKLMWAEEIEKYLFEQVSLDEIHVVKGANDALLENSLGVKVIIISYHMVSILQHLLLGRQWKCLVCDEAHFLHTNVNDRDATYTTVVCHLARQADYCLFLTGTPSTSSPFDMFNILNAIAPNFFGKSRWEFALRFCRIHFNVHPKVMECTRKVELSSLLHQRFMIRRHKEEILDLPEKWRTILRVSDPQAIYRAPSTGSFQSSYAEAWRYKWDGIAEAISFCLSKFSSVVCFAHHRSLLDRVERFLALKGISSIRIDGGVDPNFRESLLQRFASGEARVAVMGITACAVGVSLVSAESGIFCELPPDAAWMSQAEDRLHRPGQKRNVNIYYIVGVHSNFDERHFNRLRDSFRSGREVIKRDGKDFLEQGGINKTSPAPHLFSVLSYERVPEGFREGSVANASSHAIFDNQYAAWFTLSRHTGRIHIGFTASMPSCCSSSSSGTSVTADSTALKFQWYTSMTSEEANACIRGRSVPFWQKLDEFLTSFWSLSPYQRRLFLQIGKRHRKSEENDIQSLHRCIWWASGPIIWSKSSCASTKKTNRYSEKDGVSTTGRPNGWSCWYAVPPRPRSSGKYVFYLHRLAYDMFTFLPTCLNCGSVLTERRYHLLQGASHSSKPSLLDGKEPGFRSSQSCLTYYPGAIVKVQTDAVLFCGGQCREDFFVKKSSSSLRYVVRSADDGVCNSCHIDCEKLCSELLSVSCSASSGARAASWSSTRSDSVLEARRRIVERYHPLLMQFPRLVERLVRQPLPGHLWHADHILPVSQGGGECTIENIQTLCVACHQLKTQEDMKRLKKKRRQTKVAFTYKTPSPCLLTTLSLREKFVNVFKFEKGRIKGELHEILTTQWAAHKLYHSLEVCENPFENLERS